MSQQKVLLLCCRKADAYGLDDTDTSKVFSLIYHEYRLLHPNELVSIDIYDSSNSKNRILDNDTLFQLKFQYLEHLEWFLLKFYDKKCNCQDFDTNFAIYSSMDEYPNQPNAIFRSFGFFNNFCILDLCVQRRKSLIAVPNGQNGFQTQAIDSCIISRRKFRFVMFLVINFIYLAVIVL